MSWLVPPYLLHLITSTSFPLKILQKHLLLHQGCLSQEVAPPVTQQVHAPNLRIIHDSSLCYTTYTTSSILTKYTTAAILYHLQRHQLIYVTTVYYPDHSSSLLIGFSDPTFILPKINFLYKSHQLWF